MSVNQKGVLFAAAAAAIGLVIGGLIGHFGTKTSVSVSMSDEDLQKLSLVNKIVEDKWASEADLLPKMINMVDTKNLRENLKVLTAEPHLAATDRDNYLAGFIRDRFLDAGFDSAELVPYKILLTRPDRDNPNKITIQDGTNNIVFESQHMEQPLRPEDANEDFIHAFNGFAPAGDVTTAPGTAVVYANYGRVEDFEELEKLGVNVSGHIVIVRYGKIFRGNKLRHAEEKGAKGVILFSDPQDVALEGVEDQDVYPNSFWLPGSGMQRGTTYMGEGDPLTPGWPATEHAYRVEQDEADLPKIPCQPIGYNDARVILEKMSGTPPPESWKGGLKDIEYNLGPQMKDEFRDHTIRLVAYNTQKIMKSYNVIGSIKGEIEPDRYVMIGNHRDAWGYGASDPSSGTAQMLETARVLGELMKGGWRPRRTLVFCSWGAEEYGLIGSTEWVQEHVDKLQERGVMYINTDTCASGPILNVPSSPLIWDAIQDITKMIPGVRNGKTIHDEMEAYHKAQNKSGIEMKTLGGGSDYASFAFYCGIPCIDVWFRTDKNKYPISTYPAYHTGYETFYMVDKIVDPGFRIIQGCSRVALLTLKYFGDSVIIPYSIDKLPESIKKSLDTFKENGIRDTLIQIYDKYAFLEESVDNFTDVASEFARKLKEKKTEDFDPMMVRAINDQIMKLEQVFVLPAGLPNRPEVRHAIFAPSQFDSYAASGFPGISDLLHKRDHLGVEEKAQRDREIKRHVSDLTIMVNRATSLLKDFHFI